MNNVFLVEQTQALHNRVAEASYETHAESVVVVLLYQLVQVQAARTKQDTRDVSVTIQV